MERRGREEKEGMCVRRWRIRGEDRGRGGGEGGGSRS